MLESKLAPQLPESIDPTENNKAESPSQPSKKVDPFWAYSAEQRQTLYAIMLTPRNQNPRKRGEKAASSRQMNLYRKFTDEIHFK